MSEFFEIAYAVAAKRLCLFTGTGFSKALTCDEAPGWRGLLERVCDNSINDEDFKKSLFPDGQICPVQLDEAAQIISIELSKDGRSVHQEISSLIEEISLSGDYPETKRFLENEPFRVITTNYDKLLEMVAGNDCQSLSPGRPIPRSNSRVKAFHVHGSVDVPERMVVTSDDYFNFMNSEAYFSRKLSTVLHENTVVILGYSLGDTNLKAILSDYRGFVRNHVVSNSIFLVSKSAVNQNISDYYSNCYGIRVISEMEIEEFFEKVNAKIPEALKCLESSQSNIKKVLYEKSHFTDNYLQVESSFYEIVSAIGAIGESLNQDAVVKTFSEIITKKMSMTKALNAWPQYVQLASWLNYLGSLIDVRGTSVQKNYLEAIQYSMEHMSNRLVRGYSWNAYRVWDARWSSMTADNRALVSDYVKEKSINADALEIVSRG